MFSRVSIVHDEIGGSTEEKTLKHGVIKELSGKSIYAI
jgi:hypothetical protein